MDESTPAARRSDPRAALVAWAVIAVCVGYALWSAFVHPERHAPRQTGQPSAQRDLQLRYAVGIYELMPAAGAGALTRIDAELPTPESQLRVAVIARHIGGPDEARRRLAALAGAVGITDAVAELSRLDQDGLPGLSAEERAGLAARLGWAGELALVEPLPADDARRIVVLAAARRTALTMVGALVGGLALLAAGVVAAIVLFRRWREGRLGFAYPTPLQVATRHPSACLEGFAVYLATFAAAGKVLGLIPGLGLSATWLYLLVVPLVLIATVRRGFAWADLRQAIGWHRGRGVVREIGAGALGWLAGLPLIGLALVATIALNRIYPGSHPIEQELAGAGVWRLLAIGGLASVFAPVVEETMFRGLLFHHLRSRWSWLPAALLTSAIFAALHPQGVAALPALTAVAMVLAWIRAWRGSLIAPIAAHALHNGILLVVVVLSLR